jgi:predicted dehydrogenase
MAGAGTVAAGMRVLVIGAGSIGRRHHDNLTTLGASSRLVSWRDGGLDGVRAALDTSDAAVIATATDLRLPLIVEAAARNLPVYVEKPLAFQPDEVAAIADASAAIAGRSVLGYMMRYHPAFRALAQADLSDVFHFALSIGHDVTQWRANWRFSDSYAAKAMGGGVLLDLCHEVDMAACLFPGLAVSTVEAMGHPAYPGVDMASRVSLRSPAVTGAVALDYLTPGLHRRTTLHGTKAMHDFDFAAQIYKVTDGSGTRQLDLPLERNAMFMAAMRDFLALASGRAPSEVEHLPRLDLCLPSARLVADAWAKRVFTGQITKEIA